MLRFLSNRTVMVLSLWVAIRDSPAAVVVVEDVVAVADSVAAAVVTSEVVVVDAVVAVAVAVPTVLLQLMVLLQLNRLVITRRALREPRYGFVGGASISVVPALHYTDRSLLVTLLFPFRLAICLFFPLHELMGSAVLWFTNATYLETFIKEHESSCLKVEMGRHEFLLLSWLDG